MWQKQPIQHRPIYVPPNELKTESNELKNKIDAFLHVENAENIPSYFKCLFYLNRVCMDFISRFLRPSGFELLWLDIKAMTTEDFNNYTLFRQVKQKFIKTISQFYNSFSPKYVEATYFGECFLDDAIERIKLHAKLMKWKLPSTSKEDTNTTSQGRQIIREQFEKQYENEQLDSIPQRQNLQKFKDFQNNLTPKTCCIPFLKCLDNLVDFLNSLPYNQQAVYCLLYVIHQTAKFLNTGGISLEIDNRYDIAKLNLYEECFNEEVFMITSQSFLENLVKIYDDISSTLNPIPSLISLTSKINNSIKEAKLLVGSWTYFHIFFVDWDLYFLLLKTL